MQGCGDGMFACGRLSNTDGVVSVQYKELERGLAFYATNFTGPGVMASASSGQIEDTLEEYGAAISSRETDKGREQTVVWEDVARFVKAAAVEAVLAADGCISELTFAYPRGPDPSSKVDVTARVRLPTSSAIDTAAGPLPSTDSEALKRMLMHLLPAPLREEPAKAEAGAETAAAPDGAHASAAQGRHPAQKRKKGFKVTVAGTDDDGD